jgi:DNA polymerase elongation subunit (family B)
MNKKVGNSLFGKYSQHSPIVSYFGRESQIPKEYLPLLKDTVNFSISLHDYFGTLYVNLHSREKRDANFCFTCISSFITAYARIYLLNTAKSVEKYVVYCDTDSLKLLNKDGVYISGGNNLGDFMLEYAKREKYYAPKFYGSKTKGVHKNAEIVREDIVNGEIEYRVKKPYKFRSAIRENKKMSLWEWFSKTVSLTDDKRLWSGEIFYNQGIYSKPYYINTGDVLDIIIDTKNI